MGLNAWLDTALGPLRGCEALDGEWGNRGNLVRDGYIRPAVLAGALGLADENPETAFSDRLKLARQPDGSLEIRVLTNGRVTATRRVPASDVRCDATGMATIRLGEVRQVAVDQRDALWIGEHRFVRNTVTTCPRIDQWSSSAPDGMAALVGSAGAVLLDEAGQMAVVTQPLTFGVQVPARALYLLPGEQTVSVRAYHKPASQWVMKVPSSVLALPVTMEACHVYLAVRVHDPDGGTWAGIADLGPDFNFRSCRADEESRAIRFDGESLEVAERCFATTGDDWFQRQSGPPRRFAVQPRARVP